MSTNDQFPSHYKDFINSLNNQQVEYLLIGGYALGAYGHIRGTNDLDIFIHATETNALKMIKACIDYGIPKEDIKKEMFLVPKMIGIGDPPLRIEILKTVASFDFEYAFERKITRDVNGVLINVVDLDDLIMLKKAAIKERSKARDQEDLNFLQKLKSKLSGK
ncbi:MAG: nucleotidyltransferase [Ekhidna sp.]|uniref:nucleotidyltransferase n=1 Tax=Ekhidna sp. TaxID=2608089 RepID=UPI0032EE9ECD